ncbi:MAG: toxin-antitoxin system YwqK family antitoxin [Hellea sp.]|nr:toxin-antitoxin system YwqK family antitoxin [Hellea sp.]
MKNTLLILLSIITITSCSVKEVKTEQLVNRDGLDYEINSTTPFTGLSLEYHENGQLKEKVNIKDGRANGPSEVYSKEGVLRSKIDWKEGDIVGMMVYFENGQLMKNTGHQNMKPQGATEEYYPNGQLKEKMNYKDGELVGVVERYYDNGQLQEKKTYKDGNPIGVVVKYYDNGQIQEKSYYKNGKLEGILEKYHPKSDTMCSDKEEKYIPCAFQVLKEKLNYKDGTLDGLSEYYGRYGDTEDDCYWSERKNYKEGILNGISETIQHSKYCVMNRNIITNYVNGDRSGYSFMYENGVLLDIAHYQNDKKHGIYIYFQEDGTALTKYFKNGTETAKESIDMYHSVPDEG